MIDDIYRKVDPEQPVPWWLVPVEPDYEAAWDLATGDKFGYIGEAWQQEQDLVVLDRDDLFAIVDAALGIDGGRTDDEG